MQTCEQVKV